MTRRSYTRFEVKKEDWNKLPPECGVYTFRDSRGEIIYVGKAKNIFKRVNSHLHHRYSSPLKRDMAEEIDTIGYFLVPDEHQALLLENELIKTHQPRYNLRLKDDKSYPYIVFSPDGDFPAVRVARRKTTPFGQFFGPFTDVKKVKEGLKLLRSLFLLRGCAISEKRFPLDRPCLDFELGLCCAPCLGSVTKEEYGERVKKAQDFLNGDYERVLSWLEQEMWKRAEELDFEEAARYRDRWEAVNKIVARYQLVLSKAEDVDFIDMAGDETLASLIVLRVRKGRLIGSESFLTSGGKREEILREFGEEFYLNRFNLPSRVCWEGGEIPEIEEEYAITFTPPLTREEKEMMTFARSNAEKNLEVEKLKMEKRERASEKAKEELQTLLGIPSPPEWVEGVDISTFQGGETVGAVVSFKNGLPDKNNYRKFIIRETDYPNDYECLREVLERHLRSLQEKSSPFPDLILVDGGIGQLNVALEVLENLGVEVPVVSLAEEWEDIYLPGEHQPLRLPPHSEALQFLQRVRNEAHRFAITFHRLRRNKQSFGSILEEVKGIGPKRKKKLLSAFNDLREILEADSREVSKNLGIPEKTIEEVKKQLEKNLSRGF